jgi:sigma-B regulation protein RsbQ
VTADVLARHNVTESGKPDGQPIVFALGFGCDQNMWRLVAPAFADRFQTVSFDHVGSGGNRAAYDVDRYGSLDGYAADVVAILDELDLHDVVFVGHSVSAMIGVRAVLQDPSRFGRLVLVGPSPRYIDDEGYVGGFSAADIDELLQALESNYLGWSAQMAPVIMGNPDRPELGQELTASFCTADPAIARRFAEVTFRSDNRADLPEVTLPTLVLQCTNDVIAPVGVGEYVAATMPNGTLAMLSATGHCPHLSAPAATIAAIDEFLAGTS